MKKLILPIILILTVVLFLPSKVEAQTRQECDKTRDRASYNCLLEFGKCYSPCVAKTKDNMGCRNSCKQAENACDKQVDADYKTCLGANKKDSENPSETNASSEVQTNQDCHGIFTKESNACLKESTECIDSCVDKGTAAMNLTVDGGKVMKECTRSVCDPASKACDDKTAANFRACLDAREAKEESAPEEAKKETPKQNQNSQDSSKFKLPVFVGEWFREVSDWISLGEFAIGMKKVASNLTIADDAIIADAEEEKEWDQYYQSYNSLKSQGYTHEQIEATLQKPRKRDVSMNPQELDALKAKFPAGESITDVAGITNTKLYSWEADSGALIKSTNWEKIEFKQPVVKDSVTIRTVKLEEGEIEVKVRNNKPAENQFGVDAGWLGVTVSRTHFRVLNDRDNKSAVVIVYEGEVEVKTKDGKTVKVRPDGDKPGVVGVSQKLSVVKLAVIGVVLVVAVGSVIWFLKKRIIVKSSKKR